MASLQLPRGARSKDWRKKSVRPFAEPALSLLRCPTAPYVENLPLAFIWQWAKEHDWKVKADAAGNLIVTVPGKKRGKPSVALLAHLDHPAMQVERVTEEGLVHAAFYGGHPGSRMVSGKVRLFHPESGDGPLRAEVVGVGKKDAKTGRLPLQLKMMGRWEVQGGWLGEWDVPYGLTQKTIRNVVCDNLAGAATILASMALAQKNGLDRPVQAWFTRCEENGFVGCLEGLRLGSFSPDTPTIVLECSPQLPSALPGDGPVLRVGDRSSVFDAELCESLRLAALELEKKVPGFQWQRKLMDGGSCEATALCADGRRAVCLAMPLRNYHNVPDDRTCQGPRAEEIDRGDQEALVLWIATLCLNPSLFQKRRADVAARLEKIRKNRSSALYT
jgi:endoglucanase